MSKWHTFRDKPDAPVMVEYYFGNYPIYDLPQYRDEKRAFGFFDGRRFCELGTGHEVFESWKSDDMLPTHWREATRPPETK